MKLFELPKQDVGISGTQMLKEILELGVADQSDKYASHFLWMKLNKLKIWFSFDEPIAFMGRQESAVLTGVSHNSDMHAFKVTALIRERGQRLVYSMRSEQKFHKLLTDEIKKEIIHTSSEVMSSTLGVD